ncbi:uncharacterized protein LOC113765320 [Coffea eugenioides]|uniref:Transmembrane protein n=1 Tax=Coffea arabica TaxID=13443 RepID=A0A6P6WWN0_COFAR|nr:uncharacterized protein LOC113736839 [Coffea arabica]XP_027165254.1 uncharacterized protein LOC113765320 [Coffea eugenioides]
MMEKAHQVQQWWKLRWLSFKHATIVVCLFNVLTALFLLQGFLSASSFGKFSSSHQSNSVLLRHIKESEEIRRAMIPVDLIKRVKEIEKEAHVEPEAVKQKDTKQGAASDLVSRLNNLRSYSDAGSLKALEEWRKRKMERARQRELGKNGTVV